MRYLLLGFMLLLATGVGAAERIVALGSTVAEIAADLGATESIVAVDASAMYPASIQGLPRVGYYRAVAAEGILAFRPTLIIASSEVGPPAAVEQIKAAGVRLELVHGGHSTSDTLKAIGAVAQILGREAEGAELIAKVEKEVAEATAKAAKAEKKPRVVFVYARGGGVLNVGGRNTAADAMIVLAGGVNAVTEYEAFRPLTAESLVAARPDVIVFTATGFDAIGGSDGALGLPGVALTPAGRNGRIVTMDDQLLLGFGPRVGQAITELNGKLFPEGAK